MTVRFGQHCDVCMQSPPPNPAAVLRVTLVLSVCLCKSVTHCQGH